MSKEGSFESGWSLTILLSSLVYIFSSPQKNFIENLL